MVLSACAAHLVDLKSGSRLGCPTLFFTAIAAQLELTMTDQRIKSTQTFVLTVLAVHKFQDPSPA